MTIIAFEERWRGSDNGLITSYEVGIELRQKNPELVTHVTNGELPVLGWKGGRDKEVETKKKFE